MDRPLLRHLDLHLPWCELATYPSPVEPLPEAIAHAAGGRVTPFTKRDDLCSPLYGGNKVRALEVLLAQARDRNAEIVCTAGASGSNHVLATALHGQRLGLRTCAVVFEQPPGPTVSENSPLIHARSEHVATVAHWSLLPAALLRERYRLRTLRADFLPPGGASPLGVLGHVSAGLELAEQVEQRLLPPPDTIVVGLGSGGTAAGLVLGLWLAPRLGMELMASTRILTVRVAPWPLASRGQVLWLAHSAGRLLARLSGRSELIPPLGDLSRKLALETRELGRGYGHSTSRGERAAQLWTRAGLQRLDLTYSAKVAAAFLRYCSQQPRGTALFWSTKSSAPLPPSPRTRTIEDRCVALPK